MTRAKVVGLGGPLRRASRGRAMLATFRRQEWLPRAPPEAGGPLLVLQIGEWVVDIAVGFLRPLTR